MQKYLFTLLFLLIAGLSFGQGWEHLYGGGGADAATDLAATPDGGYILAGSYGNYKLLLVKVDPDGDEQWIKSYSANGAPYANAVICSRDTGIVAAGYLNNSKKDIYLFKADAYGVKKWSKTFGTSGSNEEASDLLELPDGNLIVLGFGGPNNNLIILKTDAQGNQIWYQTYGLASEKEQGYGITLMPNGDLVAVGAKNESLGYALRIDGATGNQIWARTYDFNPTGYEIIRDVKATPDGNLLVAGSNPSSAFVAKIDGSGNVIWSKIISGSGLNYNGIALANDGGFFVTGSKDSTASNGVLVIGRFSADSTKLWEAVAGNKGGPAVGYRVLATTDGGAIAAGLSLPNILGNESRAYLVKSDASGHILSSYIKGSIFWDKVNLNNQLDPNEPGLGGWIAVVSNPNNPLDSLFIVSREDGSFQIAVNPGTYKITLYRTSDYWQSNPLTVEVPAGNDTTVIANVPVRTAFDCPRNQVDVATPILRRCTDNIYTVRYCNTGTTPSQGTYVEVKLDSFLTITGSSAPYTQNGNILRFNVGTVNTGDCGNFTFNAFLDCNNTLSGQTHCVSAHIYPDTFCNIGTWDRSIVEAIGKCDGDSVRMYLKNRGIGAMSVESDFVIAEDVLMLVRPDNPLKSPKLDVGEIAPVWAHAKTGSTYRIIATQTPGYPGFSRPTAAVEGCNSDTSTTSLGFYTMFPEDDKDAFVSANCQESVESDFNPILFKRGHPKGYGVPHYVSPQTDLDFLIQFRNTGTDTVQQIIVRDTLSAALNPASIEPGASSHPYQFSVYGNNIVEFIITNANLLPQGAESEGFVKFRVAQRPNLPCHTDILNTAEITFDFNAPKFTNETFHTVCDEETYLILATKNLQWYGADLRIYPNPFEESTLIEVQGVQSNSFELSLYDTQGRLLSNQVYSQPTFRLYRHQIPAGIIFYRLTAQGKPVATGKLIAE